MAPALQRHSPMRPPWPYDARAGHVRAATLRRLGACALGLCALALLALLWPRALPLEHAAADQTKRTRHAPAAPAPRVGNSCESTHAESEPSCVHPSGREAHERP
jgi:hypothetical protein